MRTRAVGYLAVVLREPLGFGGDDGKFSFNLAGAGGFDQRPFKSAIGSRKRSVKIKGRSHFRGLLVGNLPLIVKR